MLTPVLSLALIGLATATPLSRSAPELSTSQGFNLVVKLNDPSSDLEVPVDGNLINSIHVGAGLSLVGATAGTGRIFYQNGTAWEQSHDLSTILTDSGTPPFPAGLKVDGDDPQLAHLDGGPGQEGFKLNRDGDAYLLPEQFLACYEPVEYYHGRMFVILRHSTTGNPVPEQCRAVRLVPQCTKLNNLPDDAISSHEFAAEVPCYDDVSAVQF